MRNVLSIAMEYDQTTAQSEMSEIKETNLLSDDDLDMMEHLEGGYTADQFEVAVEGFARAVGHDVASRYTDGFRTVKGYFLSIESKRRYIEEICDDIVKWCNVKKAGNPDLTLSMGAFKTWMKTSEVFWWRYYFFLDDKTYNNMINNLKNNEKTELERWDRNQLVDAVASTHGLVRFAWFVGETFNQREAKLKSSDHINNAKNIDDLIKTVELYKKRSNEFFKLILERKLDIKGTPLQMSLMGALDLRRSVKKTVNLAL